MLKLHPVPDAIHHCNLDNTRLQVKGWYIPGMRNLADLRCPKCGREFYGDLLSGHGLYFPMLLDKRNGEVHNQQDVKWFAEWLRKSYANRTSEPIEFVVEEFRPLHNPLLLNCLDTLYGHCLLKLLNAQYYLDRCPDFDLIVLVPKFLRWMVPDGVAAIWTVDLPLSRGIEWNDWLAAEIHKRLEHLDHCWLSVAYSHPHPRDYTIQRFTRVQPFPIDEWNTRLARPTVTFIWRGDRVWSETRNSGLTSRMINSIRFRLGVSDLAAKREQTQRIIRLATSLRESFPKLDFAVVGLGKPGGMPGWIKDLRTLAINTLTERDWCERYAASHLVIGVHGSSMLLPSAHAGATVELMPLERWGNIVQDLLMSDIDCRMTLFRYRIVPMSVSIQELTLIITSLFYFYSFGALNFRSGFVDHDSGNFTKIHRHVLEYKLGSSE